MGDEGGSAPGLDLRVRVAGPRARFVCGGKSQAHVAEPIRPEALAGHELLLLEDPHCLRRHALEFCGAVGAEAQGTVHANSLNVIVQLVSRGFGATLLPSIALPVEMAGVSGVSLKRFAEPVPGRTIGLAWRTGSPHAGAMEELAAVLRAHAEPQRE